MHFITRGMLLVGLIALVVTGSTLTSGQTAAWAARYGLSENLQLFLTGLAGVIAALIVGAAILLLLRFITERE